MPEEEKAAFWKSVQCTVEKDVVRTDRCHPYFSGDGNPNIDILKYMLFFRSHNNNSNNNNSNNNNNGRDAMITFMVLST